MAKKIINLNKDGFIEPEDFSVIDFEVLIYYYQYGSWDGSGFAVWRNKKGEWSYSGLGHCSCYGPTENLIQDNRAKFTIEQIKNLPRDSYDGSETVLNYLESKKYV